MTLAPAPTKEGYTFNGWTTDDVTIGENDTFEMPKQNVTLKATWTKNTKTLTITKNWEGTTEKPTVTFQLLQARKGEENTTVYQTFELDGIVDTEGEVVETAPWTATIKVPVKDDDDTEFVYSVKETKIGGTSIGAGAFNVTGTNPDNTSYIIGTWSVNSSGRPLDGTWTFTNKYTPKTPHTLTYQFVGEDKPDDVTSAPDAVTGLYAGQKITLADPTTEETGWTFDGWYEKQEDIGKAAKKLSGLYEVTKDATLYGEWTYQAPQPETVNVSYRYEAESGTLPEELETAFPLPEQTTVNKGSNITISKDAAQTGSEYPVDGGKWVLWSWIADNSITGVQQDVTFTGTWKFVADEPKTTKITVKKEWGTGVTDEQKLPVVVRLLDHGVAKWIEKDITLDGDNKWIGTFTVDYDAEAKYSVIEAKIGTEWFYNGTATIDDTTWEYAVEGDKDTGFTITNSIKKDEQPEPPTGTFKVDYVYKTLDGVTLPDDALAAIAKTEYKLPDEMTVDAGETVYAPTTPTEGDKVTVDDGEWEFVRWDTEYIENISEGATFTGYWKFTAKEPEPKDHEFTAHIVKRFENKSGKSPKATFTFIAALEDGTEVGRETISFSKGDVDAGKIGRDDVTMTVTLTDTQYKELERDEDVPYLWIYEEDGEVDGVKYDTKPQKAYIYEKPVAWSLEFDEDGELVFSVPDENTLYCLVGDEMVEDFVFTNTYKKPGEKGETIKSGPQLNRDDHVAYIMGYPDGTVQPKGEITRAEACTIFFRLLTESSRDYYFSKTNDYTDVNAGDWFNNAISTLSNAGIVTGYNDGTFRPNQPITRGEMAKIIANFANLNKGTKSFTDLSGHWSKTYVELAAGNGWIAGYPDGSFRPDQKITRAETVTMINRVLERVPAKELRLLSRSIMLTFPDNNPGDWYYIAIQEASNSHEYQRSVYETTGDEMWTKLIDNVDWTKLEK